ncbi:hypothetical protein ACMATS_06160 [Streptoverticillium reticulum]|uniref:hypothetical protein n=1 Tax=Streptoverticillium reticulum TaxID=1433415 RepID=UPI0039BFA1CF
MQHLRSPYGAGKIAVQIDRGLSFTMPSQWRRLPADEQARRLAAAETRRIAEARLYAFDDAAVDAVRAVADDMQIQMPVTKDVLPAPSGMLVFSSPVSVPADDGIITAATWGPAMDGFGEGVHLSWWSDTRAYAEKAVAAGEATADDAERVVRTSGPLLLHVDMHLPFVPAVDGRLYPISELEGQDLVSAPAIRAIVAAWYALKHGLVTTVEMRAEASVGRALAAEKAKHRGVVLTTADDAGAVTKAVAERASALAAEHVPTVGGLTSPNRIRPTETDEAFLVSRDDELPPSARWLPEVYRAAAHPLKALEEEASQRYPGVFEVLEELRAREFGQWPSWCWMPMSRVATALVTQYGSRDHDDIVQDAIVIAGLGAWRAKGRTAVTIDWIPEPQERTELAPADFPDRLPFHGVELVHTEQADDGSVSYAGGVLAFMDYNKDRAELLFLDHYNRGPGIRDVREWQLLLTGSTLAEAAEATAAVSLLPEKETGGRWTREDLAAHLADRLGDYLPYLSMYAAPDANKAAIREAGAVLGRRPEQSWPPEPGSGPHMTMWMARPRD